VPHFTVTRIDGTPAAYAGVWQLRNLLLVVLPDHPSAAESDYLARLTARDSDWTSLDTACVITRDEVSGVPRPGVLVADRWGEIHLVAGAATVGELTPLDELVEWLRYISHKCPECEGEAR
jgi:hypothetical protein